MKRVCSVAACALLVTAFAAMTATSAMAAPVVIYGDYIGQDADSLSNSNLKVIGDPDVFNMDHFVVDLAANTVSVYGKYFANIGTDAALGTTLSDLFMSTNGYHPYLDTSSCEAPALKTCADNYVTGTQWNLAAVLDNHTPDVGSGGLFNLWAITPANYLLSEDVTDPFLEFRHGQVVRSSGGLWLGGGSYWVYSDHITFNFGLSLAALGFGEGDGLRFTESCANDILEGEIPVPEPGSMMLLGTGLIGLAGAIRRRLNAR